MPKKKKVDNEKLIKAVESGTPSTQIMAEFGIKTSAQLKNLYLDALVEKGMAKGIAGGRKKSAKKTDESPSICVNKRGSLVINRNIAEEMGWQVGDTFLVRKTKSGLNLKKQ